MDSSSPEIPSATAPLPGGSGRDSGAPAGQENGAPATRDTQAPGARDKQAPGARDKQAPGAPDSQAAAAPDSQAPAIRASDRERDAATHRLQEAFAEGRLDDAEFDTRMRSALSARTRADLDGLLADLPAASPEASSPALAVTSPGRAPGKLAVAFKSSVRRAGRWRVPDRYTTVVYKGGGWLDLRAAELTAPVTTMLAVAYKSRITILVPPGIRVEAGGFGADTDTDPGAVVPADAPVLHVRGFTYKGTVEVRSRPPED